jgi:hypothetical protein
LISAENDHYRGALAFFARLALIKAAKYRPFQILAIWPSG